ncbi:hypothetical protein CEXT_558381 [Caerostris extrusa]|uniref:Uncharacterized protein n=1 Tax=Caerostris extrusa TaxID=172846 RepID=A0AAV4PZS2_CAEEX|nr:hypothetical protein CEXT_558381 [Caerostris extrusa]
MTSTSFSLPSSLSPEENPISPKRKQQKSSIWKQIGEENPISTKEEAAKKSSGWKQIGSAKEEEKRALDDTSEINYRPFRESKPTCYVIVTKLNDQHKFLSPDLYHRKKNLSAPKEEAAKKKLSLKQIGVQRRRKRVSDENFLKLIIVHLVKSRPSCYVIITKPNGQRKFLSPFLFITGKKILSALERKQQKARPGSRQGCRRGRKRASDEDCLKLIIVHLAQVSPSRPSSPEENPISPKEEAAKKLNPKANRVLRGRKRASDEDSEINYRPF